MKEHVGLQIISPAKDLPTTWARMFFKIRVHISFMSYEVLLAFEFFAATFEETWFCYLTIDRDIIR